MDRDKRKTKDLVEPNPVVDGAEPQKSEESGKIETYLITLPSSLKTSTDIPDKKKSGLQHCYSQGKSFGLGPFVFPSLQRFNNVKGFLFLSFLATLPHGKPSCQCFAYTFSLFLLQIFRQKDLLL